MSKLSHSFLDRRAFLKRFGTASLGVFALEKLLADPYAFAFPSLSTRTSPIPIPVAMKCEPERTHIYDTVGTRQC